MTARAYIGASHSSGEEVNNAPLKGVDGIIGVVMMLAYYASGENLFPSGIDVEQYVEREDGRVSIADQQLSSLLQDCSTALNRHLKTLTLGSVKVYLSWLRKGKRPRSSCSTMVDDELLTVNTTYDKHGKITVSPRMLREDIEMGVFIIPKVPDWIQLLAEQKGFYR